jgi:predicted amino acid dehydrogenase
MKLIINISLGSSRDDYELKTTFLGKPFHIRRFGTDHDLEKAADLLLRWNKRADAIGLGNIKFPSTIGSADRKEKEAENLRQLARQMHTPVTSGDALRTVCHEWSLRHLQFKFGNNLFNNARVLFFSGVDNATLARVMSEFTENLFFADPILEHGLPRLLTSMKELDRYANRVQGALQWIPGKNLSRSTDTLARWNDRILRKAIQQASVIVVPTYDFFRYVNPYGVQDLKRKVVITSTAYDDRIEFLQQRRVDLIIDTTPMILERVVGVSILEAMTLAALGKPKYQITSDDLLEMISDQRLDPRLIYRSGAPARVNRFAFVLHPLSREYLPEVRTAQPLSPQGSPSILRRAQKVVSGRSPEVYSTIQGIRSPTGVEAEGWLISLGISPDEMRTRSPEFLVDRLLQAAVLAKRMGAQVMGISPLTKEMAIAGVTAAQSAPIPITTGNSYIASSTLWAAAAAVRRMGLIKLEKGKILKAKTMVIGATGAVGSICSRLLAKAFQDVYLVGRNIAKLLALQESILQESPDVRVEVCTRAEKHLREMDVIVTAASGASKILDIRHVKPGCVISDVTRPMILSPEDVALRPDVLVIKSGEVYLPGNDVRMKGIGLPPNVVTAGMAETIVLALEGRFETFTLGSETEWKKVREVYRMGLKHGMQLAAISGVNGVITDDDIRAVKRHALEARQRAKKGPLPRRARVSQNAGS